MFAKLVAPLVALALATGVASRAVPVARDNGPSSNYNNNDDDGYSFNNYGGSNAMSGFDDWYGKGDFAHYKHFSPVVVSQSTPELVCHSEKVKIVQQRLAVLQEMAKRIITEQVCEVESQTVIFQQYYASLGGFSHDMTRNSGRPVGYDHNIASHYESIWNSDGTLSNYDFNFTGTDIGSNYYSPSSNWDQNKSPSSVGSAYQQAQMSSFYY